MSANLKSIGMKKSTISIANLPLHTKRAVIVGMIQDVLGDRKSGFSINVKLHQPTEGYAVGGNRPEVRVNGAWSVQLIQQMVEDLLTSDLLSDPLMYIGGWREDGECVIDVSTILQDRDEAIRLGRDRGERAIYDLNNQEDISFEFPFEEGDDYYTIENGKVIYSCWDDISEMEYDPNEKYFATREEAEGFLKSMKA